MFRHKEYVLDLLLIRLPGHLVARVSRERALSVEIWRSSPDGFDYDNRHGADGGAIASMADNTELSGDSTDRLAGINIFSAAIYPVFVFRVGVRAKKDPRFAYIRVQQLHSGGRRPSRADRNLHGANQAAA